MRKEILIFNISLFVLLFCLITIVHSQTTSTEEEILFLVKLDEDITAQDLGVGEPTILPDSPFYFFKKIKRKIQTFFTFDPIKKAKLQLKFANEKLIEAKKLAEKKNSSPEKILKTLESSQKDFTKVKEIVKKLKNKIENPEAKKILEKVIDTSIKQQRLFDKFEKQLPKETHEKLKKIKTLHIQKIAEILQIPPSEFLQKKLPEIVEKQKGSKFKEFKSLEILKNLQSFLPEESQKGIETAQERILENLKRKLEKEKENSEKFKKYLKIIGGNELVHLEILEDLEQKDLPLKTIESLKEAKEQVIKKVENRLRRFKEKGMKDAEIEFLKPLLKKDIKGVRIIKELEKTLPSEFKQTISSFKKELEQRMIEKIKRIDTDREKKKFLDEMTRFTDPVQLETIKELENLLPLEKKEIFEELKDKVKEKIEEEIKRAQKEGKEKKKVILEKLSGEDPQIIEILDEFKISPFVASEIIKHTTDKILKKVEEIKDLKELENLKNKIQERKIKFKIQQINPLILEKIKQKEEIMSCAKAGEKVNRNPLLGPTTRKCCPGLYEVRVSKSYSICKPAPPQKEYFKCTSDKDCSQLRCPGLSSKCVEGKCIIPRCGIKEPSSSQISPNPIKKPEEKICIQVITYAISPEGECREFPTPCHVPEGWKKVEVCPKKETTQTQNEIIEKEKLEKESEKEIEFNFDLKNLIPQEIFQ